MDGGQIAEWLAFEKIEADAQKKAEMAARAEHKVKSYKRGKR